MLTFKRRSPSKYHRPPAGYACAVVLIPLVSIPVCSPCRAQQASDACRDVLQDGIRDQFSERKQTDMESAFKTGFCNGFSNSTAASTAANAGVSVPLAGDLLGLKGGFSQSQQQDLKSKYCSNANGSLSNDDYTAMMKRVASANVLQAWTQCMHDRAPVPSERGLVSQVETAGSSDFIFKFKWIPALNQNTATVGDFYIAHAACSGSSIAKGALIGTEWSVALCQRQGNEPVLITLEAANQLGATVQTLAPIAPQPPPKPAPSTDEDPKAGCMGGSATKCSDLWKRTQATCGFDAACIGRAQCWMNKSRALTLIRTVCDPDQNGHVDQESCRFQSQNVRSVADKDCDTY